MTAFKKFLRLLFRRSWFTAIAILSVISTIATFVPAFYRHFAMPRWVPPAAILLAFFVAAFRVYAAEANAHASEVASLKKEIAALKVKPYDEHKRAAAERMLSSYSVRQRDLLRYVLTHTTSTQYMIAASTKLSNDEQRLDMQGLEATGALLRDESDSGLRGIIRFSVSPGWAPVFQDILFPRTENVDPPFYRS